MLAQAAPSAVDSLAIAFAALLVAVGPVAMFCTKVTDATRNFFDKLDKWPKVVWNIEPLIIGVLFCLGFRLNAVAALANAVPALAHSSALNGIAGQVATGLFGGAWAGFWHDKMSSYGGKRGGGNSMQPAGPSGVA